MRPTIKPQRNPEQLAEEQAIRQQHRTAPRQKPASAISQESFAAILSMLAQFKTAREAQMLTLVEVAQRMGIDSPALSRLETGTTLNPTLATLHKWAEALGQKLHIELRA